MHSKAYSRGFSEAAKTAKDLKRIFIFAKFTSLGEPSCKKDLQSC